MAVEYNNLLQCKDTRNIQVFRHTDRWSTTLQCNKGPGHCLVLIHICTKYHAGRPLDISVMLRKSMLNKKAKI